MKNELRKKEKIIKKLINDKLDQNAGGIGTNKGQTHNPNTKKLIDTLKLEMRVLQQEKNELLKGKLDDKIKRVQFIFIILFNRIRLKR